MNSCGKSIHVRVFTLGDYMKPCIICSLRDIYIIRFTFIIIRTFVRTLLLISRVMHANKSNIYEGMNLCAISGSQITLFSLVETQFLIVVILSDEERKADFARAAQKARER